MLDLSAPAQQVARKQAATALWRGLVNVISAPPIGLDPSRALLAPGHDAAHAARRVRVPIGDHATPGWLFTPKAASGATVVLAHGTTAEGTLPYYMWIQALLDAGINVLTFELDGHGENPRVLCCPDIEENVPAALAFARRQPEVDAARVGVMGVSLGGACAVNAAAADVGVRAVVTVSSPHRIQIDEWGKLGEVLGLLNPEVASTFVEATPNLLLGFMRNRIRVGPEHADEPGDLLSPGTRYAVQRALRHLNPLDAAARLAHAPLLVINGEWDFIAPTWQAHDLYARAGGSKSLAIIPRRNHFTVMLSRPAVASMADWFRRWL